MKRRASFFVNPVTNAVTITFHFWVSDYTKNLLKEAGFRWNPLEKSWNAPRSERRLALARSLEFVSERR